MVLYCLDNLVQFAVFEMSNAQEKKKKAGHEETQDHGGRKSTQGDATTLEQVPYCIVILSLHERPFKTAVCSDFCMSNLCACCIACCALFSTFQTELHVSPVMVVLNCMLVLSWWS
jgi:hypothetical protein